jgi:hypothetical protein
VFESNEPSLNNKSNHSIDNRKIQLKEDLNKLGSEVKNSENDKIIFKYVAKNVDNVSNYNDYSLIQKNIKNVAESANSSERTKAYNEGFDCIAPRQGYLVRERRKG